VYELLAHDLLDRRIGRGDPGGEGVAGLFVEVTGETLELRRQAQQERLVERGCSPPLPTGGAADPGVGLQQVVKMFATPHAPRRECSRCHDGQATHALGHFSRSDHPQAVPGFVVVQYRSEAVVDEDEDPGSAPG
jgi:hypothetical protein